MPMPRSVPRRIGVRREHIDEDERRVAQATLHLFPRNLRNCGRRVRKRFRAHRY
jgi:hypothetical protein